MDVKILHGDCLDILPTLEANSVDSVVTDPPYHLTSIVKRFANAGSENEEFANNNPSKQFGSLSRGFMGKQWDGGDVAFRVETWREVIRVLKPGGHLLACGGTRTYHRMVCAIEDAGFEIRDCIQWLYGSGFPKSHDVSKGIDKAAGVEFTARPASGVGFMGPDGPGGYNTTKNQLSRAGDMTPEAAQWEGWGTALKPANEPIVLARKPLSEKTVAANVLRWGTGAINVGACRVGTDGGVWPITQRRHDDVAYTLAPVGTDTTTGRWPANVLHDGSEEVVRAFPRTASRADISVKQTSAAEHNGNIGPAYGKESRPAGTVMTSYGDEGSAARFFYTAKADKDDRLGSKHPTVKPVDLMAYLCRLVTPPGGIVLDPFAGSGSTGMACMREGFECILIEREAEYVADIENRIKHVSGENTPLFGAAYGR